MGKRIIPCTHYDDIFTTPINFSFFQQYLAKKRKNRSPSMSNIRIDHICSLPDNLQRDICLLLSIPYVSDYTFTSWDHEIISWIPKEAGNPALDRRRPITLLEVMRKICIGVKKNQVFNIWFKNNAIHKDNFAFVKGKSTTDAILIKRFMIEDALHFQKPLYLLDVDYKAAYDKVPYFIKEMCLRRMGLPEKGIALWCKHDIGRMQQV